MSLDKKQLPATLHPDGCANTSSNDDEEHTDVLQSLGWDEWFAGHFEAVAEPGLMPGRVICEYGMSCEVSCGLGEVSAEISGRMRYQAVLAEELPVVGDWVAVRPCPGEAKAVIHALLTRRTKLARRVASRGSAVVRNVGGLKTDEQILAANVDTVFVVCGLDHDFNLRRIERYLVLANENGVAPVVLLNKTDVCTRTPELTARVESIAAGVPVHAISALDGSGTEVLLQYLRPGKTTVLVGSSGAGKSTLANRLLGTDCQETRPVREDDQRGRHTTVRRELLIMAEGGVLLDTPGLRELQILDEGSGLGGSFDDIESLAAQCRFRDCTHGSEPGCAVLHAVEDSVLDGGHFRNYLKLKKEQARISIAQDARARAEEKRRCAQFSKHVKQHNRSRSKRG